jgi:choice-of-anchor C domain-containing protein
LSFRYRAFGIGALAVVLTASVIAVAQQPSSIADPANLIQNGSFESPSIWQTNSVVDYLAGSTAMPDWTIGGNSIDLVGENYWDAEDGDQSVDLSGSAPGSVSQSLATTAGTNYTLTWYMAGNTNCGQPVKTMDVYWDGALVDAPTFNDSADSSTSMGWVELQLNVQATGSSSAVEFADATPDQSQCGATLDNVSLVPAVTAHPVFTEDSPPLSTLAGTPYSAIFFATGVPAYSLTGAPSWLSITPSGAVTGTPPSGTTSFSYSVSASNADGSAVAGPYTVTVQAAATVTGTVVDGGIAVTPVVGSPVQDCVTGTGECQETVSGSGGAYSLNAPVGSSVVVSAYPLPGSGDASASTSPLTITASGIENETISLDGVSPLPQGLQINGTSAPTVYWADPATVSAQGCANGFGQATVVGQNTQTGAYEGLTVPLTEAPVGSGTYTGTIPPLEPIHGPVEVDDSVTCVPQGQVLPDAGPATGGTTVAITGSGFTGATGVTFGGIPATGFTLADDEIISAVAPAGTGTVPVAVQNGGGSTVVGQYEYMAVTSVTPGTGPAAGGTQVVIEGTGLGSAQAVYFGTTAASFTQVSDTEIDATSPPGTGTVDVTVQATSGQTTATSNADQFSYSGSTTDSTRAVLVSADEHSRAASAAAVLAKTTRESGLTPPNFQFFPSCSSANNLPQQVLQCLSAYTSAPGLDLINTGVEAAVATVHPSCQTNMNVVIAAAETIAQPAINLAVTGANQLLSTLMLRALVILPEAGPAAVIIEVVLVLLKLYIPYWVQNTVDNWIAAQIQAKYASLGCSANSPGGKAYNPNTKIDPSGTVLDSNGNPVNGATVTISRADTAAGPFTSETADSPDIDPNVNPETTGTDGAFHWDVIAGWYEIRASASGCTDPADSSQTAVTIGPYPVPPPQLGLTITLACSNEPPPPTPVVDSLGVSTGPAKGGTTLTVLGSGFTPASTVKFGQTAAQSVAYLSPRALTVTSPPGSGLVDVTVQNGATSSGISSADKFFYGSPPAVTGLSPSSGPTAGGTTVTISGSGFTGATAVGFGGVPATSFTVVSDTEIQATAPAEAAGTVNVSVITPAGGSAQVTADQYSYSAKPPATDGEATAKGRTSVTARLSTAASGDLVLAFVGADGPARLSQRAKVSGGGLTWTLARRTNTRNGTAEVWEARASGALSRAPITSTLTFGGYGEALTVVAFKNAPAIGATASASGRIGAPAGSLTTTSANSWVFAVGNDANSFTSLILGAGPAGVRPGSGQTLVSEATALDGGGFWVQSRSVPTPAAGTTVKINDTAPSLDMWNLTLVEIT